LVESGLLKINVEFTAFGMKVSGSAGPQLAKRDDYTLGGGEIALALLRSEIERLGLGGPKPGGKISKKSVGLPPRPEKSLCQQDWVLSTQGFQERCEKIAATCGGGVLTGRVRSAGLFTGTETVTFQDWWKTAGGKERLFALTDGQRRKSLGRLDDPKLLGPIEALQCPFRGDAVFLVASEEAEN
jgi:hypothetical protein